jgi:hypothetical protein
MNNTKLSSAAHGLNVMKTLMPTLTSKAQNASSGMSFAETLISVRTRVQTVSVTTTNTSTEMTMTEYKSYIYGKISDLPVNPTQASRSASVFISDEGFAAMKDSSEYEDWVLGKLREDFAVSNPLCERTGSYVVYQFGAKKSEYRGDSWYSELQGGQGDRAYQKRSKGAFWSNRHERHKEHMKQAAQRLLEQMHAMQAENQHVRVTRLTIQGKFYETTSVAGAALPASEIFSDLGGLGISL